MAIKRNKNGFYQLSALDRFKSAAHNFKEWAAAKLQKKQEDDIDMLAEMEKEEEASQDKDPRNVGGTVEAFNVQSWNKETHPEGIGRSQLVQDIEYDPNTNKLIVTYNDGFTAQYDSSPEEAKEFVRADSKGRWALANLWGRKYEAK